MTIGANTYAYTTASGKNRLTKTAGPAPVRSFSYDAAGNVKGDGASTFTTDARGRMSQVTRSGNTTAYTYNARGERVRKNGPLTPSGTNYFFYDEAGHLLGEYDQNGAPIQEFVWLEDVPVAVIKGNEIHHIYTDQLDTPRVILDRQNRVRWRWDAEPFGTTAPNENPSGLGTFSFNLRFPGQYFDKETNLHQNYFRDYDPATGRYVQSDPIGLAGGINPYAYVGGNPVSYADPSGQIVPWVAGGVLGGIAGGVGAALQGGGWQQVAIGVAIGAIGGATFGGMGGAILGGMGPWGMAWLRAGSGAVGSVLGQGAPSVGDPCFQYNYGAIVGSALGGATFGTLNAMTTAALTTDGMAMGLGARFAFGLPPNLAQGTTAALGGTLGKPAPQQCGCK